MLCTVTGSLCDVGGRTLMVVSPLFGRVARCGCRLCWVRSRLNGPSVVSASLGGA